MTSFSRFGRRPSRVETPLALVIWLLIATATSVASSAFQATPDNWSSAVLKGLTLAEFGDIEVTTEFAGDPGALVLIGRTFYVAPAWRERDTA